MKISACSFVIKGQQQRVVVDGKDTKYGYDTYISKRIFREQMSGGKKHVDILHVRDIRTIFTRT